MRRSSVRPLSKLAAVKGATVVALSGGRQFHNRLVGMGLNVGSRIDVIQSGNDRGGPTLIAVGDGRLAIGHGMAERILVAVG